MSQGLTPELRERIDALLAENDVVLFMKGSRLFPRCGFSATVIEVLKREGITSLTDVDILKHADLRQGMKEYTQWPTFPQLYVRGKFVGGCDIVRDLHTDGELKGILAGIGES